MYQGGTNSATNHTFPGDPYDGHRVFDPSWQAGTHTAYGGWYDGQLRYVRDGRFKLVLPHRYQTLAGKPGGSNGRPAPYQQAEATQALYDLKADVGETKDVASAHPDVVARLLRAADDLRAELGDATQKRAGAAVRPADRLGKDDARLVW